MKKYLLLIPLVFSFGFSRLKLNTEKVYQVFNETFNGVENLKWYDSADYHSVYFEKNSIQTKVTYNNNGRLIYSVRYYNEDHLPLNILVSLKERFSGKKVVIVTETMDNSEILYFIRLEDSKHLWAVRSNSAAQLEVVEKFRKQ